MNRLHSAVFALAIAIVAALATVVLPRPARADESHIYVENGAPDASMWVTLYYEKILPTIGPPVPLGTHIYGSYCVNPSRKDQHGIHVRVTRVRVEVLKGAGCHHPVIMDKTLEKPSSANVAELGLTGRDGAYHLIHRFRP